MAGGCIFLHIRALISTSLQLLRGNYTKGETHSNILHYFQTSLDTPLYRDSMQAEIQGRAGLRGPKLLVYPSDTNKQQNNKKKGVKTGKINRSNFISFHVRTICRYVTDLYYTIYEIWCMSIQYSSIKMISNRQE